MTLQIDIYKRGTNKMMEKIIELLKQRRVWATILSVVAVVAASFGNMQVVQLCSGVAGVLGLTSYLAPKN